MTKWLKTEIFFYIGLALLPFENFYFAPSAGWGTISPLFFLVYILSNYKILLNHIIKYWKIFAFFFVAVILGSITAFFYKTPVKSYIDSFVPLVLGATTLLTISIYRAKEKSLRKVVNILVISYSICIVIGLFEFFAVKLDNYPVVNFIKDISKRNYIGLGRVQFFFTEPSFVSMHLFGVLLPLYWITRRKDLLFVLLLFITAAIGLQTGVRVIVDIFVVAILYFIFVILRHNKAKFIPFILLILSLGSVFAYTSNDRVKQIANDGVYADGSLATRFFRMQSSVIGYQNTFPAPIIGYGLGNSMYPIRSGYDEALEQYDNDYVKEVNELGGINESDDAASYSLYTRFISEFGLILTIIAILYLFNITDRSTFPHKWLYLSIILYLYVQFESLGFYAIWLFVVVMHETKGDLTFIERMKIKHLKKAKEDPSIKRVLVFGITDKRGGVESVIMNYYRNIDRNSIKFDFLCNTEEVAYEDEIKELGGKIFRIPARSKGYLSYKKALNAFFKENAAKYDAIWVNVCSLANIDYLKMARKYGIRKRIIHAHNSKNMDSTLRGMIHLLNRINIDEYATDFWTCSDSSSDWFYPEVKKSKIKKVYNAFELKKFKYSNVKRNNFRKKYNLKNEKIILNIGRLNFQKNQEFIINLAPKIIKEIKNVKFVLVGVGEDEEKLKGLISEYKLDNYFIFTGMIKDVSEPLSASDLFLFPSVFEGSPVALYEAEANGINTVASKESYTEKRKLSKTIETISLRKGEEKWASTIISKIKDNKSRLDNSENNIKYLEKFGYNIKTEAKKFEVEINK